jgi:hypothetical protein
LFPAFHSSKDSASIQHIFAVAISAEEGVISAFIKHSHMQMVLLEPKPSYSVHARLLKEVADDDEAIVVTVAITVIVRVTVESTENEVHSIASVLSLKLSCFAIRVSGAYDVATTITAAITGPARTWGHSLALGSSADFELAA